LSRAENTLSAVEFKRGTWWVNSGETFDPDATVPVRAGGFVRRVARTPHYGGDRCEVRRSEQTAVSGGVGDARHTSFF
jgi:hypothetical protein